MVSFENLPETFYLGVYQPLDCECDEFDFTEYSSGILDVKKREPLAVKAFADIIWWNLGNDFDCFATVPSHDNKEDSSGIQTICRRISRRMAVANATSCLIRYKTIERLSTGGDRSIGTHLNSIKVVNNKLIEGKKVLLLDDISTTGNSLKACKQLLESAGAKTVKSFVLGKATRWVEDLEFFCLQYDGIKGDIEKETEYLEQQFNENTKYDYEPIDNYYQSEMEDLSEAFHYGIMSEEEYDEQVSGLEGHYSSLREDIDSNNYDQFQAINYDAKCQIETLDNFYEFSSLDTIYC